MKKIKPRDMSDEELREYLLKKHPTRLIDMIISQRHQIRGLFKRLGIERVDADNNKIELDSLRVKTKTQSESINRLTSEYSKAQRKLKRYQNSN